jgi:hypothetical protein
MPRTMRLVRCGCDPKIAASGVQGAPQVRETRYIITRNWISSNSSNYYNGEYSLAGSDCQAQLLQLLQIC